MPWPVDPIHKLVAWWVSLILSLGMLPQPPTVIDQLPAGVTPDFPLRLSALQHDFGRVSDDVVITGSFWYKNVSHKPVTVWGREEFVSSPMDCTPPARTIAPGEARLVTFKYNTAQRAGPC